MNKLKEKIEKFKSLNKKEKERLGIRVFVGILVIYFIFFSVFNKKENAESSNENIKENYKSSFTIGHEKIYVHLSGYIKKEGVLEMEEGNRLSDAIEKAGGLKENANIKYLNLAKKIEDGEKIYIPNNEEVKGFEKGNSEIGTANTYFEEDLIKGELRNTNNNDKKQKININKANTEELKKIPGVGQETANKIIDYRNKNKKFKNKEEIKKVEGIGEKKYDKIKDYIVV